MKSYITLLLLVTTILPASGFAQSVSLSDEQVADIGHKIWLNEGAGKKENLLVWNKGEDFPSLGIGHFLWFPADSAAPFQEQFPKLLSFFVENGVKLPAWLTTETTAPWMSRVEFYQQRESLRSRQLVGLLAETVPLQTRFIIQRLESALPVILAALESEERKHYVEQQYYRVANTANGYYLLIDYVNFKGEGVSVKERYKGQGWGLLQVLEAMPGNTGNPAKEFSEAADRVLTLRVENAPRDESRWLPGWRKRIASYLI